MLSFWKKDKSRDKKVQAPKETYSVNGLPCSRSNCAAMVKELAGEHGKIVIEKEKRTKDNNHLNNYLKDPTIKYSINLDCPTIHRVLRDGEDKYQHLIALLLTAVDTGINTIEDFGNNFQQLKIDLDNYSRYLYSYQIDSASPLFEELQNILCEYENLILLNLTFNISVLYMTDGGRNHIQKFGTDAIAQLRFPQPAKVPEALYEIIDAKLCVEMILDNFESLERNINTNKALMPEIRDYALKTLHALREMALKYEAIFNEAPTLSVGSSSMI